MNRTIVALGLGLGLLFSADAFAASLPGDLNDDGYVSKYEYELCHRWWYHSQTQHNFMAVRCDVDGDGKLNWYDDIGPIRELYLAGAKDQSP